MVKREEERQEMENVIMKNSRPNFGKREVNIIAKFDSKKQSVTF
jgi:hypothetical protein